MIADQRLSLFEYTLRCVLRRHLDAQFLPQRQIRPVYSSPQKLVRPVATVLALLAWEGQPEPDQAAQAFDAARTPLRFVTLAGCSAIACCPYFSSGCPRPEGVARARYTI